MLRQLLAIFLDILTRGLSGEKKIDSLTKLVGDLLKVDDYRQKKGCESLKRTEADRLHQLLTLRGGSAPEILLTDVALNTAERLQSFFTYSPEILLPWTVSLLSTCGDEEKVLRLVDLLEGLIELPQFNLLSEGQQRNFRLRLVARDLRSFGESDLTNTVLSLAGMYYFRSLRDLAA